MTREQNYKDTDEPRAMPVLPTIADTVSAVPEPTAVFNVKALKMEVYEDGSVYIVSARPKSTFNRDDANALREFLHEYL